MLTRKTTYALIFVGLMLLALPGEVRTPDWRDVKRRLADKYVTHDPGAYAIVWSGGQEVFSKGYGLANIEHGIELSNVSVVRIASLTKQFTAVATLALVEDGMLELEDRLDAYLVDCPAHWRTITIRQLLSHTTGVTADLSPLVTRSRDDFSPKELVQLYYGRPLDSPPGTTWNYSNVNYWILGLVIEQISGESYAAFVNRRVLNPAKLEQTRYGSYTDIIPNRSVGYSRNISGAIENARYFSQTIGYSAGGFVSTPSDMATWYNALSKGLIISRDIVELALTPVLTDDGVATRFGLGWYLTDVSGRRVAHHGGTTIGFRSYIYWYPEDSLFAGVFVNRDFDDAEPTEDALLLFELASRVTGAGGTARSSGSTSRAGRTDENVGQRHVFTCLCDSWRQVE